MKIKPTATEGFGHEQGVIVFQVAFFWRAERHHVCPRFLAQLAWLLSGTGVIGVRAGRSITLRYAEIPLGKGEGCATCGVQLVRGMNLQVCNLTLTCGSQT